jgi:hypothetical protein
MKRILLSFVAIATIALTSFGQAPEAFKYQAVIRDGSSLILTNQAVGMQLMIRQGSVGGPAVYTETFAATTNGYGLVNLEIGTGTTSDDFTTIDWANDTYFMETAVDVTGGTSYIVMGTSQLMSVPYALHAKTAESIVGTGGSGILNFILPTLTTNVTDITSNGATLVGNISNTNGNQIMERGFVLSTLPNPTVNSYHKIFIGTGLGVFDTILSLSADNIHLLNSNTTYYVRAYALTENNISSYGNEVSFTTLSVGQPGPSGGIVFFDKGNNIGGWQFLESATSDQSGNAPWGCEGTSIPGTQYTVGSGVSNTVNIVSICSDPNSAASLCNDLVLGGQNDWFLPSRDELNLMYKNLELNGQGSFVPLYYWSSSETPNLAGLYAINLYFGNNNGNGGMGANEFKSTTSYVRAVRAF